MFQVNVSQQDIKARLDVSDPFLRLQIADPKVQISSEPVKIEINSPAAELAIDSYPSNRSRGIKNNVDFDRDNAQKGMQTVYEAIGKIARDGALLAKIENKGNPLTQLAKESIMPKDAEISIASVDSPTINVTPHEAEINVRPGKLNISFAQGTVAGDLQRGTVGLTMIQYPKVDFTFTDSKVDVKR